MHNGIPYCANQKLCSDNDCAQKRIKLMLAICLNHQITNFFDWPICERIFLATLNDIPKIEGNQPCPFCKN